MQMAAMNIAYRPANISFHYNQTGSTYTIRDDWATDANSTQMKQHLRRGTYQNLNLYFQSNLSSNPGSSQPSTLLGYCTLPTTITYGNPPTEYPTVDYATDGCNILTGSMPTVPNPVYGYNQGKTAVHEIGHWFGLLHTFQVRSSLLPLFPLPPFPISRAIKPVSKMSILEIGQHMQYQRPGRLHE